MAEIVTEKLCHVYSADTPFEKAAIRDVSLSIPQGQLAALIDIGLSVPQSTALAMALRDKGLALEGAVYTHEQLLAAVKKAKGVAVC